MFIKKKISLSTFVFNSTAYFFISLATILCLMPFWFLISGSFTSEHSIFNDGYNIIPKEFSLEAYIFIFRFPETILKAYGVTIINTAVGSITGLFIISMTGYVLHRKDCKYRNKIAFFIYFTTLFQGGLIPWYILITKYYQLQDNRLVLILPMLMNPFLIILMKNFMKTSVPNEIIESAKIDGAGDFMIYYKIVVSLSLPGLATIGLFLGLAYWNDWYLSSLYISTQSKYSLQFYLYNSLNAVTALRQMAQTGTAITVDVPTESARMAMAIVCTGPIIFLYPFVQKYFIKGLTIGAVKG